MGGEFLHVLKPQPGGLFFLRKISCPKQEVPQAEDDSEILPRLLMIYDVMMPDMEARGVEHTAEGPPIQFQVGMIQMTN